MPHSETPDGLAEEIADMLGAYGVSPDTHEDGCGCRLCFTLGMAQRIRDSVANEEGPETPEPVFSCAECVSRMSAIHWRHLTTEESAALRALASGGPGTLGEILHRVRRKARGTPLYRLMQAVTTLVAEGKVESAG